VKAGKRTAKFENKMDRRGECTILTECWREKKKNTEKKEREKYQRNGYANEEVERLRSKERWMNVAEWKGQRHRNQERRETIKESRYNRKYEKCMTRNSGVLGERECKESKIMARSRCGNEEGETGIGWKERREGAAK
jgi:hypothetical protein